MAFKCDNCGKGLAWGHRVSHSKRRTSRVFRPNIQKKKIVIDGVVRHLKLCTNCIKLIRKIKKVKASKESIALHDTRLQNL